MDHGALWRTHEGDLVLTAEPYEMDGKRLVSFIAECAELGLSVTISGASPHNPGSTFILIVRAMRSWERMDP
jgi:hypothetical protein